MILVDAHGLLDDAVIGAGDTLREELLPLRIRELNLVDDLELLAEILLQLAL